ncbi:MAG: Crp/Fnr family transcriptional regulator [Ardenticatenaceae bacterium]|nr:Crp/Fnr family transcriptional regulator [Ardenticatenaceae bacterium]
MFEPTVRQSILTSPLFKGLNQAKCEAILASAHVHQVRQGDYFFHQGEDAAMLYVMAAGRVKLTQVTPEGEQVIVNYFGPGDGLGIIVALINMPYPLSAEAMEACTAVAWDRAAMKQLMLQYPQLALNGIEMIGQRFAWLQTRFQEVATQRVEQRVARALLRLVRQFGKRVPEGVLIDMPLSRQDLAEMTGTNLYNASRILSKWEQQGLISTRRMQVILCKAHDLVMIAEDLPAAKSVEK